MIVWKEIKPKRFEDKAFRDEIVKEIKTSADDIEKDFEKTTATWRNKPDFEKLIEENPPTILVSTDDEIYRWVNDGTEGPYEIWAGIYTGRSDKRALAFPRSSTPKTKPRVIGSSPGARSSDKVIRPYVTHPGIEPRHFDEEIQKIWEKKFKRRMEDAMKRAAKASGHSLS